jgi:hypothetical protein
VSKAKSLTADYSEYGIELSRTQGKTLFLAWHLIRGGICNPDQLEKLAGVRVESVDDLDDLCKRLIHGPVTPLEPVRCMGCGAKLVDIPCAICGPLPLVYN